MKVVMPSIRNKISAIELRLNAHVDGYFDDFHSKWEALKAFSNDPRSLFDTYKSRTLVFGSSLKERQPFSGSCSSRKS